MTELTFDDLYLGDAPTTAREMREMRADASLLISQPVEVFCREIVLNGRLPSRAYELAFSVEDAELGVWVKPDNPSWQASKLLKLPEVRDRVREIRDEVITWGGRIEREEVIANLRGIAFDPSAKHVDRLAATKQLSQLEGLEAQPDAPAGGVFQIVLPFIPQPLKTITLDNDA